MRKLLIISPNFPPSNAADMQRIRMSLFYFKQFGWEAEVVTVNQEHSDFTKDNLLLKNVPAEVVVHYVKAFAKTWTLKLGLGSIALRSFFFYRKKVNRLLQQDHFDLIYFSTTQFPVCVLGAYWKKKFGVPYVIDMQDPWHSEYYRDKPRHQQPKKYWLSYRFNKLLEPVAIKNASGLISVSAAYITDFKKRYPEISAIPSAIITFGAFEPDLKVATDNKAIFPSLLNRKFINIVYVGRGGNDMRNALIPLFKAFKKGLADDTEKFKRIRFYFIGTSYAPDGQGKPTILPFAKQYEIEDYVVEITNRISYYHTLHILQEANALFIPGSDDPKYTASKIFPYLLTHTPILAIFNKASSAIRILKEYGAKNIYDYENVTLKQIVVFLQNIVEGTYDIEIYKPEAIKKYSARQMTIEQCEFFDEVING
jgi:hypothetical protein